jgi:hypothetical protein
VLSLHLLYNGFKVGDCLGNVLGSVLEGHQRSFACRLPCPVKEEPIRLATATLLEDVGVDAELLVIRADDSVGIGRPSLGFEVKHFERAIVGK